MKTVLFERTQGVYLPEITAYRQYMADHLPGWTAVDSGEADGRADPMDFDIVWRFMGLDRARTGRFVVHEYNSLSTGTLPRLKDRIKRTLNARPQARIFLNETVRNGFGFNDPVPFRNRDMGVSDAFFNRPETAKIYDFVYAGSLNRGAAISTVLDRFKNTLRGSSLLVIGNVPQDIGRAYGHAPNITVTGRVAHADVPALAATARYALNLMPDRHPFNIQTATKVLEYCALGLPVVSTDYAWIRAFERERGAAFFYLAPDLQNLTPEKLDTHAFKIPDVRDLGWRNIIRRSGIFEMLDC